MRLIDADALERMGYVLTRTYQQDQETMVYETKKLSDMPSAQPEIIRCKDCKWSEQWDRWLLCGAWEAKAVNGDDYCSDAERRTE